MARSNFHQLWDAALEAENTQLKKIVAQQAMDINALQELLSKKW